LFVVYARSPADRTIPSIAVQMVTGSPTPTPTPVPSAGASHQQFLILAVP